MFSLQNVQALLSLVLSSLGLFTVALTSWGLGRPPSLTMAGLPEPQGDAWPWPERWHRWHRLHPHTPELSPHMAMSLILSEGRKDLKVKERKSFFFFSHGTTCVSLGVVESCVLFDCKTVFLLFLHHTVVVSFLCVFVCLGVVFLVFWSGKFNFEI